MMSFGGYCFISTVVAGGNVAHAYLTYEQFYPAVVYLSTDKISLGIMYNLAFMLFITFGRIVLRTFVGQLRDLEYEQLIDSSRGFLADTILFLVFYAPTIDGKEVNTVYLIQCICCVLFMKVFHLIAQIRVTHMFEIGVPRLIVNIKLMTLMLVLLGCDFMALNIFYSLSSKSSTFYTWVLFEALTMVALMVVALTKYVIHLIDLRLENGWPSKSANLFYVDLFGDVITMTIFLFFMLTFFLQNPQRLPIYLLADIVQVARQLAQRLGSFRKYRKIVSNIDQRFADATPEEVESADTCIICRDKLWEGSKKLPCGHIFHMECLKSWLVMQQCCPTCRAELNADAPLLQPVAAPRDEADAARDAPAAPPAEAQHVDIQWGQEDAGERPPQPASAVAGAQQHFGQQAASSSSGGPAQADSAPAAANHISGVPLYDEPPRAPPAYSEPPKAAPPQTAGAAPSAQAMPAQVGNVDVEEILEAMKFAKEMAESMRQQAQFWMAQVRVAQTGMAGSAGPFPGPPMPGMTMGAGIPVPGPLPTPPRILQPPSAEGTASAANVPSESSAGNDCDDARAASRNAVPHASDASEAASSATAARTPGLASAHFESAPVLRAAQHSEASGLPSSPTAHPEGISRTMSEIEILRREQAERHAALRRRVEQPVPEHDE
mmetsp:Transcript_115295/g.264796  ORF Transcript_115295/g.264796 Transcript_115295/m.264796 type:complete len:664 (-) Transcript_115295:25-2016(-)